MASSFYNDQDTLRVFDEGVSPQGIEPYRSEFRRDYARLIHSPSFRRLHGKTQLFPGNESDFFRNRLTHSLEVAQIAKSIACKINYQLEKNYKIDLDLVEFAGLAHDLGHPPFGHQGEEELDQCMLDHGGFEGNAQTLRILSKLEKKLYQENEFGKGYDNRKGLNLTYRSYASILKYDSEIPGDKDTRKELSSSKRITPVKGYYNCESELVREIKKRVLGNKKIDPQIKFKTIECSIMDLADDIAYSTYDLEDTMKAGFLRPFDLVYPNEEIVKNVSEKVSTALNRQCRQEEVVLALREAFSPLYEGLSHFLKGVKKIDEAFKNKLDDQINLLYGSSMKIANSNMYRINLTSNWVGNLIRCVKFNFNEEFPQLSFVYFEESEKMRVEILKRFVFEALILSPKLKTNEYRGKKILKKIFYALTKGEGNRLLPDDYQGLYNLASRKDKPRIICDFISSMTDRYAIEFYSRLYSESPQSIFKPY